MTACSPACSWCGRCTAAWDDEDDDEEDGEDDPDPSWCVTAEGDETMPKTSEMRESKFLKQTDVGRGALGTVERVVQMNVAKEGADPEMKWCLTFADIDKPLVLNATNIQLCEKVFGSDDTDHWHGKRIVLYTDPNVSFQGKLVGGIRVRAPKPSAAPPPPPPPVATGLDLTDDDIPFAWLMPLALPMTGLIGLGMLFA